MRRDKDERYAPLFKNTDRRDVGLLIDKSSNTSTSCFKIKVLHLCIRTANKYGKIPNHGKEHGSATGRGTATA